MVDKQSLRDFLLKKKERKKERKDYFVDPFLISSNRMKFGSNLRQQVSNLIDRARSKASLDI